VASSISETTAVVLDLSPMKKAISDRATALLVEAVTNQIAESSTTPNGVVVRNVTLINWSQSLEVVLEEEDDDDSSILHVKFDVVLEYVRFLDGAAVNARTIIWKAFGTELARNSLLLRLVLNDTDFAQLQLITVISIGGATIPPPLSDDAVTPSDDTKGGSHRQNPLRAGGILAVTAVTVMTVMLVLLAGWVMFCNKGRGGVRRAMDETTTMASTHTPATTRSSIGRRRIP
jgi:hypothetical protein